MSGAFETPDRNQENVNVRNTGFGGELVQLPRYTSRRTLTIVYSLLIPCLTTAIVVQTLSFMPLVLPYLSRLPWIVLACGLLAAGALAQIKREVPWAVIAGVVLGAIVGL